MTAKFCVFCGSKSDEAEATLRHKELYLEYSEVAALLAWEIELKEEVLTERAHMSKVDILKHFDSLVEKRKKIIENKDFREAQYAILTRIFSLPIKSS